MANQRPQPWVSVESDNLTGLTELNEDSLLKAVRARYESDLIYTDVGDILVAVNPFRKLPIYDERWSAAYSRSDVSALAPHIYRVAARAFNSMVQGKKDQVCVISGESGAGKTESAKFIMHQVMDMCKSAGLGQTLQAKIIQLNPLLEAFGNASTALNSNSSRFGKYIQLVFQPNGRVVGAGLEQYLLEKSRVCVQGQNERNFHIFYYLYAGLDSQMLKDLQLKTPTQHRYLSSYHSVLTDCTSEESKASFNVVIDSMHSIGFGQEEIQQLLTILAAIILIGDIEFVGEDGDNDNAEVSTPAVVESVAQLLHLEGSQELAFALTTLRTTTRGETVDKRYTCTKAADVRDAIAKALYAKMFQWIVLRINAYLQPRPSHEHLNIGILDIFGFENFDHNSFEQFCINLANEQLQQYFNHQIFAMEKVEYAREGLEGLEITYKDNRPVLDLFLSRPIGLLSLLDEQCRGFSGTEKAFVQRCRESFGKHPSYKPDRGNAPAFTVSHYAGDVKYEVDGFLEKNKDLLPDQVVTVLRFSDMRLVWSLFSSQQNTSTNQLRKSMMRKSQRTVMRAMSRRRRASVKAKVKPGARKLLTVSAHFRQSLELLMERVFAASPHFVRCIKPNMDKLPHKFENDMVLKQLRYTGMLEAVRVRREGFSYRPFFSDFCNCYRAVAYYFTDTSVKASEHACQIILDKAGITGWRLGRSRVFLRYFHEEKLQLLLKEMEDKAVLIQKVYRGYHTRKWVRPLREAQKTQNAVLAHFLTSLNKHGQECFPKLLDLNKTDIKLAVKRFGNKRRERETEAEQSTSLSVDEKKRNHAKKIGIMVPIFGPAVGGGGVPIQRRKPSDESEEEPELETHRHASSTHKHGPEGTSSQLPQRLGPPPNSAPSQLPQILGPPPNSAPSQLPQILGPPPNSAPSQLPQRLGPPPNSAPPELSEVLDLPPNSSNDTRSTSSSQLEQILGPAPSVVASTSPHDLPSGDTTSKYPEQHRHSPVHTTRASGRGRMSLDEGSGLTRNKDSIHYLREKRTVSAILADLASLAAAEEHGPAGSSSPSELKLRRPVGGVMLLPPNKPPPVLPKPSPRKPPTPKHKPAASPSHQFQRGNYQQNRKLSTEYQTSPKRHSRDLHRNLSGGSDEVTSDAGVMRTPLQTQDDERGSTLDFKHHKGYLQPGRKLSGPISISVPDLLSEDVFSPTTSPARSPARSRNMAEPSFTAPEERNGVVHTPKGTGGNKKLPRTNGFSTPFSPSRSPKPVSSRPKDEERRSWKFKFGFKRRKSGVRNGSSDGSVSSDTLMSPAIGDIDLMGFYPSLSRDGAVEMVLGQPRGTYVIYKEETKIYSDQPTWHPAYRLVVSEGRIVNVFPITISGDFSSGLQFHLEKPESDDGVSFPDLPSLVDYYKKVDLSEGLHLLQPRLIAGVSVAHVPSPASGKQTKKPINGFHRGRLAGRRKS